MLTPTIYHVYTPSIVLLAFDSLCGATAKITKHLLAYYSRFRISTRLPLSLQGSNMGCQTFTSLQQSLLSSNGGCQTCNSLRQSLWSSNRGCKMCTSVRQSLQSLNRGCQTCTSLRQSLWSLNGVRERLLAFDSLCMDQWRSQAGAHWGTCPSNQRLCPTNAGAPENYRCQMYYRYQSQIGR